MYYVILTLAAILIGLSIGALASRHSKALMIGSLVAIALGIATLLTGSWHLVAIGAAIYLLTQLAPRDSRARA
ncbi:hypothetical protein H0484_01435 [Pusillimonas sp. CC-YST705]|uniref:Transmembrane protein n=1 Tax=Mesopusillimonas faecipullorum TaxID=2755040 RepID=A0ABS8C9A1_9BURK|nr:hypothetical protein [Mesopusillimonas faecipullorum]MCB5362417.1 hypothetical protein [Mesopusillimonas faecipullorum]